MKKQNKQFSFLKLWIIIVMIIVFSFYPTFAADKCDWAVADTIQQINVFFWNAWRFCSWIWILLWNYAWVLMTNAMVYWEFLWLDSLLWKIWQISRSMANYALWAMFIYGIFKYIFTQEWEAWSKIIKNMLVTSVIIQASWFIVMALVDLATIALATVSAFPSQVVSVSSELEKDMKTQICKNYVLSHEKKDIVVINAFSDKALEQNNSRWYTTTQPSSSPDPSACDPSPSLIDSLLPQADSFWWIFMYLWFTALNAQDYMYRSVPTSSNCVDDIVKTVINIVLDAWMLLLYTISLAILIILLIMRLWYLWIFIAISPIIALVSFSWLFKSKDIKSIELLDYKKAIFLIFQPVIFGLWMSLMFLFVLVVQWLFASSPSSEMWSSVVVGESKNSSSSTDPVPKISSSLWNSWIIDFTIRQWSKSLKDVLLAILILVLMWELVKLAVSWEFMWFSGIKSINDKLKSITNTVWTAFSSANIVPVPWWAKVWLREVTDWNLYNTLKQTPQFSKIAKNFDFDKKATKQKRELDRMFWLTSGVETLNSQQKRDISRILGDSSAKPNAFKDKLADIKYENYWLIFSDIREDINNWIKVYKEKSKSDNTVNDEMYMYFTKDFWDKICKKPDDAIDIDSLFKENDNASKAWFKQFYTNVLWWKPSDNMSYRDFIEDHKWKVRNLS